MKILLLQTSWLGDTILSTPVISNLNKIYPDSEIWMLTTRASAALVERDPLLRGVLTFDKRRKDRGAAGLIRTVRKIRQMNFDIAYSLHKSYRTSLLLWLSGIPQRVGFYDAGFRFLYHRLRRRALDRHDVHRNLSLLSGDFPGDVLDDELRLFAPEISEVDRNVAQAVAGLDHYIVLVPGSAWTTKMWPWEGYRAVARHLLEKGRPVVLLGDSSETTVNEQVAEDLQVTNLAGKTSIADAMFVIRNADLIICNDSMALHMASAFKVPGVAIFCSTSPAFGFGPWKNKAIVLEKENLECKPCGPHGRKRCPTGTEACMREVPPKRVIDAAEELLGDTH